MISTRADVLIHVDEPIDDAGQSRIAGALASLDGVSETRSTTRTRNLMVVYFDPSTISTCDLLHAVQSQGLSASLVGF
jgi:hypothetical protein